ncbi:MAG: PilT/PilU family type 4a pilus ATPase [Chloroflexi bacterium]|nr:PilT/PilU family type 4a pilus ATPase [Chloroflexota bacterium]
MKKVDEYLQEVIDRGASDLHLSSGSPPIVRIHGELMRLSSTSLSPNEMLALVDDILEDWQKEELMRKRNIDLAYEIEYGNQAFRFRCNAYFQRNGIDAVFRAIPNRIPTLEELNLPQSLERFIYFHQGLILFTGPAGCGKTGSMASILNLINEKRACHIVTIEDPIEYVYKDSKSVIHQRQVGIHTYSLESAMRAAMREDPDVLMIGELSSVESIKMAITAAETGHLVLSTMHTSSAAKTIDRLIDSFPHEQQAQIRSMLAESLRGIITQYLMTRQEGWGRIPAVEVLIGCPQLSHIIREARTYQIHNVMLTNKGLGMITLDESLKDLLERGKIGEIEALELANDLKEMRKSLTGGTE